MVGVQSEYVLIHPVSAFVAWIGIPRRGFFYNHLNATSKIKDVQPDGTRLFAVDGVQI